MNQIISYTPMNLTVLSTKGGVFKITVGEDALVEDAKAIIGEQTNTPVDDVRLIFNGAILKDFNTLSSCGITDKSRIVYCVRPPIIPEKPVVQAVQQAVPQLPMDDDFVSDMDLDQMIETNFFAGNNVSEDEQNIAELVACGFDIEMVRQCYEFSGKNKEIAANMLIG